MNSKALRAGRLYAVEGISGSGKSTFARGLAKSLAKENKQNRKVVCVGGFEITKNSSELTKLCRRLVSSRRFLGLPWLAELHLLIAEFAHDIEMKVSPALREGATVVFDGYLDSLFAYQLARLPQQDDLARKYVLSALNAFARVTQCPTPHHVFFLSSPLTLASKRIQARDKLPVGVEVTKLQRKIVNEYSHRLIASNCTILKNGTNAIMTTLIATALSRCV